MSSKSKRLGSLADVFQAENLKEPFEKFDLIKYFRRKTNLGKTEKKV